jgi:hypothetical protein
MAAELRDATDEHEASLSKALYEACKSEGRALATARALAAAEGATRTAQAQARAVRAAADAVKAAAQEEVAAVHEQALAAQQAAHATAAAGKMVYVSATVAGLFVASVASVLSSRKRA